MYTVVANWVVGLGVSGWVLSLLSGVGVITAEKAGFQTATHALIAVLVGTGLGLAGYLIQKPPTRHPTIVLNGFAQVLTVSLAEVMVCWAVVGTVTEAVLQARGFPYPTVVAALVASVVFGIYHIAHSPPFNSIKMIVLLAGIGLVTSLFFFVSRDIYGTVMFHNFLGMFGVLRALHTSGKLQLYERFKVLLISMALLSIVLLIVVHVLWVRP